MEGPRTAAKAGATLATTHQGARPSPRFTLANERTFLAWNRTALALVVAGLGIVQLLPPFPGVPWGRHILGVPLIVLGATVAGTAYAEWRRDQVALRHGRPLPRPVLPLVLAGAPLVWAIGHFAVRRRRPEQSSGRLLVTLSVIVTAVLATLVAFLGHSPASLDQILPRHG